MAGCRSIWHAIVLFVLAACGLAGVQAQPAVSGKWQLAAEYWIDRSDTASLGNARTAFDAGKGRAANHEQVMPLGSGAAVWYRFTLPIVFRPTPAVFEVPFAGMDSLELFRPGARHWQMQRSGDALPVDEWPMRSLRPAFEIMIHPEEPPAMYLRVRHSQDFRVSWVLWDARAFHAAAKRWYLALGAYAGFIVLVVLLSLVNAVTWRDSIHVYYAVHVILLGLSIASLTGLAGEFLWPTEPWWNDKAPLVLPAACLAWAGLFVRELVAERGTRLVSWALLVSVAAGVAMALAFLVLDRQDLYPVPHVYTIPSMALMLAVLGWHALRRPRDGIWVLAGWAALAIGGLLPILRNLGFLPNGFLTQYGLQIGGALEIPLVLTGLYLRSRERRDNQLRLSALSRTDPLTGVANHRVLIKRLDELLRRGRHDPLLGAVLRVRILNLEAIGGEHGREAAEAALLRATECVLKEARAGDTMAREQGGDLVLLLDGPVSRQQAAEAGRNVIARGLKFSGRLPPQVTLPMRVAGVCAPLPHTDADGLLAILGRTIQQMGDARIPKALRIIEGADPGAGDEIDSTISIESAG